MERETLGIGDEDELLWHAITFWRMRRTGTFDLLCLLGDIGTLNVRAGSCYLVGSTGPLKGAREIWGKRLPPSELSRLADETACKVGIPYDIFENALCMWGK